MSRNVDEMNTRIIRSRDPCAVDVRSEVGMVSLFPLPAFFRAAKISQAIYAGCRKVWATNRRTPQIGRADVGWKGRRKGV
jgi:hypothetical protein